MKVLIGCEFSGVVREAFSARGHDAWSCDFLPTEIPGSHIIGNVLNFLDLGWDLAIFHPPCTYLAISGARHFAERRRKQKLALDFVWRLLNAPISRIALENPVSVISTQIRHPDQIYQPYQFGEVDRKRTCLWLKNLPPLQTTNDVSELALKSKIHQMGSTVLQRARKRSRTPKGVAAAMAEQ
jgi:hypothetical protein